MKSLVILYYFLSNSCPFEFVTSNKYLIYTVCQSYISPEKFHIIFNPPIHYYFRYVHVECHLHSLSNGLFRGHWYATAV